MPIRSLRGTIAYGKRSWTYSLYIYLVVYPYSYSQTSPYYTIRSSIIEF